MPSSLLALLLHIPLMAGAALLLAGLEPWLAARIEGRTGPPLMQPLHDARRHLRKQPVRPEGTSPWFAAAPLVSLGTVAVLVLLVPSFSLGVATAPLADLLVIAGLLALSRAALALAALDAGSAPASLSALDTLRAGMLAEPALLAAALILALLTASTNLDTALLSVRESASPGIPLLLAAAGLAASALVGDGVDCRRTGYSGWHRAALDAAVALRRVVWLSLAAALLFPATVAAPGFDAGGWALGILAWSAKLLVLASLAAAARRALRHSGRQPVLGAALLLVLLALLFLLTGGDFA